VIRPRLLLLITLAGCSPSSPDSGVEVAAELRALRQVMLSQAQPGTVARGAAPAAAAADIAHALEPLRQALEGLAGNQHELQQRQLALTQELQRWSTLLVETTTSNRRQEGEALSARLAELEAALQAQDTRHREVEVLMQGALERTADRLGEFLLRVGADVEPAPAAPEVAPTDKGAAEPQPAGSSEKSTMPAPPADATPPADERTSRWERRGSSNWWWGGVASLATLVGVFCLRRWRHAATHPRRDGAAAGDPGVEETGVQEIWAAAALLGEAVGRLRDSTTAAPTEPADQVEDSGDDSSEDLSENLSDDLIVIDDELLSPPSPDATVAPTEELPSLRSAPAVATCRLRTEDPARSMQTVLQILQQDPRVLRRPEPAVRCSRDCLEVSFRLVPELPAGERSHLEQRLRDACNAGA